MSTTSNACVKCSKTTYPHICFPDVPVTKSSVTVTQTMTPHPSVSGLVERLRKVVPHAGAVTIFDMLVAEHRVTCDRGADCQTPPIVEEAKQVIMEAASTLEAYERVVEAARDFPNSDADIKAEDYYITGLALDRSLPEHITRSLQNWLAGLNYIKKVRIALAALSSRSSETAGFASRQSRDEPHGSDGADSARTEAGE